MARIVMSGDPALGAIARINAEARLAAIGLITHGEVLDLALELNENIPQGSPGDFTPFSFTWRATPGGTGRRSAFQYAAEAITGTLHVGTHIDGLTHVQSDGKIFGGHDAAEVMTDRGWAEHGMETVPPIVARALILDIAGLKSMSALPDGYEVTRSDIQEALRAIGEEVADGDVVLVRTGKIREFYTDATAYQRSQPGVGVDAATWLYDQGMAVLGTDTTGTEPLPFADPAHTTHKAMLVERGVMLLENVYLDECASRGISVGLLVCTPLKITGATGSWVRPILLILPNTGAGPPASEVMNEKVYGVEVKQMHEQDQMRDRVNPVAVAPDREDGTSLRRRLTSLPGRNQVQILGVLIAAVLVTLVGTAISSNFLTGANLTGILQSIAFLGFVSIGMGLALIGGEIDISVGSMYGLAAVVTALFLQHGVSLYISIIAGLATGLAGGLLNGLASVLIQVPVVVITLASLGIFRAIALVIAGGSPVSGMPNLPGFFNTFGQGHPFLGISYIVIFFVVLLLGAEWMLRKTSFGFRIFAVGANPDAARLVGFRVNRVKIALLTLSGLTAAVGGVVSVANLDGASPTSGTGYELSTLAALIIGGLSLNGGIGSLIGVFLGLWVIGGIQDLIVLKGVDPNWVQAVSGLVLIVAMALTRMTQRRRASSP
jgi:ribose/xylose/arabinose/galactoside ABC-type transport system permease subunit/kynurenine formamidase